MTGQVKEEILTRMGELGVAVRGGALFFAPTLLRREEFLPEPAEFSYWDVEGVRRQISLDAQSLAFTCCQTPVVYKLGNGASIDVVDKQNNIRTLPGSGLDRETTRHILARDGQVKLVRVTVGP